MRVRQFQILFTKNKDSRLQQQVPPLSDSTINNKKIEIQFFSKNNISAVRVTSGNSRLIIFMHTICLEVQLQATPEQDV